ncbi:MAG: RNA polymerase sigma-70 factor [Chitinophagaceae bacterium]
MPMNSFDENFENTFKGIFETYKNALYQYVLAITHSAYAAEEITQEIFLKLWLCRDMLHGIDNMDAYLFTIARNKTINYLRKAGTQASLMQEIQNRMKPAINPTEEYSSATELEKLVHDALNLLSPQRRLVYQLSRQQGLDHAQIAAQLQLSRNTVKNHLVYTLRFIRSYLGQHGAISILLFVGWLFEL